jgi:molybdenum cofactor cytidylyltransferase
MNTAIIILAAGSSSRLGQSKQMLDIDGEKLLVKTIKTALGSDGGPIAVVLGANEKQHREILKVLPVHIVYNEDWQSGMGSSLKKGLRYLLSEDPSLEAVVVLVCDQPLMISENINNLILKHHETKKAIIASRYAQMPGVPVLFDKIYFPKLMSLPDDQGAKKIILQHNDDVFEVDFPGGETDLDRMEDYDAFKKGEW